MRRLIAVIVAAVALTGVTVGAVASNAEALTTNRAERMANQLWKHELTKADRDDMCLAYYLLGPRWMTSEFRSGLRQEARQPDSHRGRKVSGVERQFIKKLPPAIVKVTRKHC